MVKNIIDRFYSFEKLKKIIAKNLGLCVAIGIICSPFVFGAKAGCSLAKVKNKPKTIVKKIVEKNNPLAFGAAFDFLKNEPNVVKDLLKDYESMQILQKAVFERNSGLEDKLVIEDSERILLSGEPYFSNKSIGEDAFMVPVLNMLYDSDSKILYKINKEQQILEKTVENVEELVSFPDAVYFVHKKDIFVKNKEGRINKITEVKGESGLKEIQGANSCIIFENKKPKFIRTSNEDKTFSDKLYLVVSKLCENEDFELDEKTKFVYNNQNEKLYMSSKYKLFVSSPTDKSYKEFAVNKVVEDFIFSDVDEDGTKELAVLVSGFSKNWINVYKIDEKTNSYKNEREYSIKSNLTTKKFISSPGNKYRGLNPPKFKEEVLAVLEKEQKNE